MDPEVEAVILEQLTHMPEAEAKALVTLANTYGPVAVGFIQALLARWHVIAKPAA